MKLRIQRKTFEFRARLMKTVSVILWMIISRNKYYQAHSTNVLRSRTNLTGSLMTQHTRPVVTTSPFPSWPSTQSTHDHLYNDEVVTPKYSFTKLTEIQQFLEKCPTAKANLREICLLRHSCNGRCGQRGHSSVCSCEKFCLVYKDCCWDFEKECPKTVERFYQEYGSAFKDVVTESCRENKILVIAGCGGTILPGVRKYHKKDFRIPCVSIDSKLSFRNLSVYNQCLGKQNVSSNALTFLDYDIYLKVGASVESVKDYFRSGSVGSDLEVRAVSKAPRMCPGLLKIKCRGFPEGHACKKASKVGVRIRGSRLLCQQVQQETGFIASTDTAVQTTREFPQRQQEAKCRATFASEFIKSASSYIMTVNFANGLHQPEFRQAFDQEYFDRFECKAHDIESPCDVIAVCKTGYIPINFICRKATTLVTQVVGMEKIPILKLEDVARHVLKSLADHFPFVPSLPEGFFSFFTQVRQDASGFKAVTTILPIQIQSEIVYDDKELPFADHITSLMLGMLRETEPPVNMLLKLTLCFEVEKQMSYSALVLCDDLVFNEGVVHLQKHYKVSGTEFLDPFGDMASLHSSFETDQAYKSVSQRNPNIAGVLTMMLYVVFAISVA